MCVCVCVCSPFFFLQSFSERLQSAWVKLQMDSNCYVDSDLDKSRGKDAPSGIRQVCVGGGGVGRGGKELPSCSGVVC